MGTELWLQEVTTTEWSGGVRIRAKLNTPPSASWQARYQPAVVDAIAFGFKPRLIDDHIEVDVALGHEQEAVIAISATVAAINLMCRELDHCPQSSDPSRAIADGR